MKITNGRRKVEEWVREHLGRDYVAGIWRWELGKSPAQEDAAACDAFACINTFCACISHGPLGVYGQSHIPQLRDHIRADFLNGSYLGELAG